MIADALHRLSGYEVWQEAVGRPELTYYRASDVDAVLATLQGVQEPPQIKSYKLLAGVLFAPNGDEVNTVRFPAGSWFHTVADVRFAARAPHAPPSKSIDALDEALAREAYAAAAEARVPHEPPAALPSIREHVKRMYDAGASTPEVREWLIQSLEAQEARSAPPLDWQPLRDFVNRERALIEARGKGGQSVGCSPSISPSVLRELERMLPDPPAAVPQAAQE